jgi:ATPase family associated with various cellular activities (AAA)/AAA lid domain
MSPENSTTKNMSVKYKARAIKAHASDEWMADGTKKYRRVYDRFETTFMRVEFSFFNKLFDEEEWDANVRLKCFHVNGSHKNELCNLQHQRKVLKDENIVYVRDSWGNATPGAFWLKGDYTWEGYIDEAKVSEGKFYIEDVGQIKPGENPFFDITVLKLYEGDGKASELAEKKYLKAFSQKESRFIWGELSFKNKVVKDYFAELFFNFYDNAGRLKGVNAHLAYVTPSTVDKIYTVNAGWGGETPGRWAGGDYTLEIVFMENIIAAIPFQLGEANEEGSNAVITDIGQVLKQAAGTSSTASHKSHDDILFESLAELNALTGLDSIKTEVNEMVKLVHFYQETGKDILNKFSLHTVFTGNPGTGKTTVARILSRIYKGLGILEKGHLIEVDREGLVAGFVGQTAIKTGEKITEAMGGILFIDEAYSLAREHGAQHDFGGEAIAGLLKRMEDSRGKFGVIVAGYTDNMHEFINSNPGLRSRFDKYFVFEDYDPEDMLVIAMSLFGKEGVKPETAAVDHLKKYFNFLFENRDKHFGNARTVRQVVGESVKNQHLRLASMKKDERTPTIMETIIHDDVKEFEIREVEGGRPTLGFKIGGD